MHIKKVIVNGIRISDFHGLNKGGGSKFCVGSRFRQAHEEGQIKSEYINKHEMSLEGLTYGKI